MRNLKKVIALVAVFAMLVSSVAFAGTFSDVAETDNYAKAIELLNALGIVTGDDEDGDGVMDFRPEDTITRAEVTAIIARIQGMDVAAQTATEFVDVPATHWASGYVAQAASQGIVNGYGDGNFGPEDNVTYEQMLKMLMETLGYRPFAADNGGYPTGYTTAATRYGVLDGVVGGGIGVEASRGMVAQMVYNAINTPLMDPVTYGSDKEYGIYDGTHYALVTLLTRDLKMIKFTGTVKENSISQSIDTTSRKTAVINPFETDDNSYYLGGWKYDQQGNKAQLPNQTVYQGDVDVDPYLGYPVEIYAKKMSNFENNYTVVALAPQPANNEVTFTLGQYVKNTIDGVSKEMVVEYLKDENSNIKISKYVDANVEVIYNGLPVTSGTATLASYLNKINNAWSGKVTLLDTDTDAAFDVANIEFAVTAVVKEVTNSGVVRFMQTSVKELATGAPVKLVFDENDVDTIINLTKDGEEVDYTELKKWDVVTILWNGDTTKQYYNVNVLGEANYVDGSITVDKNDSVVLSDGNTYKFAATAWPYAINQVDPGMSGRFFIDAYGKIVAIDESVEIEGVSSIVDNYAYVLDAIVTKSGFGNKDDVVNVKLLDKSGEIYEAQLATKVKLVNADEDAEVKAAIDYKGEGTMNRAIKNVTVDMSSKKYVADAKVFATALQNKMIAYEGNSAGQVKTIVFAASKATAATETRDMALMTSGVVKSAWNADTLSFKNGVALNEDTKVFFIAKDSSGNNISYDGATVAKAENCAVATIASLIDDAEYNLIAMAPDFNDEAKVVVLMNEDGRANPAINIAVIDSIGTTVVNGTDSVMSLSFYMNGELQTATTKVDMDDSAFTGLGQGDLVQLTIEDGVITFAKKIFDLAAYDTGADAANAVGYSVNTAGKDEAFYFGAVTKFSNNGTAIVHELASNGALKMVDHDDDVNTPDIIAEQYLKEGDANVYVYDVTMKKDFRLSVGSLGDADTDEELMATKADGSAKTVKPISAATLDGTNATVNTPAYGMMDYVFVRTYDNKPADIVVYKNYDFALYTVE